MLITTALLLLLRSEMGAAYCACATNTVNVRSGPNKQQPILYTLPAGECLIYRGDFAQGHGYTWLHLDYKGQVTIISNTYVIKMPIEDD